MAFGLLDARIVGYQLYVFFLSVEYFCKIKCIRLVFFFSSLNYYLSRHPVYISVTELHGLYRVAPTWREMYGCIPL